MGGAGNVTRPSQRAKDSHAVYKVTTIAFGGRLTGRYAAALYSYTVHSSALDHVVTQKEQIGQLTDAGANFHRVPESPLIDAHQAFRAARAADR